jgi:hypothetical protein
MAEDVAHFIRENGLKESSIIGHSMYVLIYLPAEQAFSTVQERLLLHVSN